MKLEINLNDIDIKCIIANYYNIPVESIKLDAKAITVGYYKNEHVEYVPYAVLSVDNEKAAYILATDIQEG